METDESDTLGPTDHARAHDTREAPSEPPPDVKHRDLAEWRGTELIDRDGEKIGALQDVYFDIGSDEPQFGTVKEGWIGRHLTFVPLVGVTIGPSALQVDVTKEQIKGAPNIALEGDELSAEHESALYHHYHLNYTPTETPSGRRLARR
jgi:PRC-barrel domain